MLYSRVVSSEEEVLPPLPPPGCRGGRCDDAERGVLLVEWEVRLFGVENTGGAGEVAEEAYVAEDEEVAEGRRCLGDGGPPPSVKPSSLAPHADRGEPNEPRSGPSVDPSDVRPPDMLVRLPCLIDDRRTGLELLAE